MCDLSDGLEKRPRFPVYRTLHLQLLATQGFQPDSKENTVLLLGVSLYCLGWLQTSGIKPSSCASILSACNNYIKILYQLSITFNSCRKKINYLLKKYLLACCSINCFDYTGVSFFPPLKDANRK